MQYVNLACRVWFVKGKLRWCQAGPLCVTAENWFNRLPGSSGPLVPVGSERSKSWKISINFPPSCEMRSRAGREIKEVKWKSRAWKKSICEKFSNPFQQSAGAASGSKGEPDSKVSCMYGCVFCVGVGWGRATCCQKQPTRNDGDDPHAGCVTSRAERRRSGSQRCIT